jgi:multicomponent K+:H+ antiporter subunit G
MRADTLPVWAALPAALLLIASGCFTLIGSLGLLRLRTFFQRMHGPSLGNTLGAGCALIASMIVSSAAADRAILHELLISLLIVLGSPITAVLLMAAGKARVRSG